MNPLFTDEPTEQQEANGYLLPRGRKQQVKPLSHADNATVQMLRRKLESLYDHEPDAKQESKILARIGSHRSKHQEFMHRLTTSGKSMAEIQSAWHEYYAGLTDREKHEVWQEFYQANATNRAAAAKAATPAPNHVPHASAKSDAAKPVVSVHAADTSMPATRPRRRTVKSIRKDVLSHINASHSAQLKAKQHLQSLAFGIGLGAIALFIALFGLFNELVVTPFIRPGNAAATPIILNTNGPAPSSTPEVIIPKLNAQLPVIYGSQSVSEEAVQKALEEGVFHYPTTVTPGQNGNVAIFGHSSNNIFNKGKYKFAFVLLREMEPGDIFYLTHNGKVYTYKVFTKKVVNPDETWVLTSTEGKTATAALITCDPPGSTRHRLVVWGEQVSPDPAANSGITQPSAELEIQALPGKAQNWLTRLNPFD